MGIPEPPSGSFSTSSPDNSNAPKPAEGPLSASEAQLRLLVENSADVIWVMDTETQRFKYVSPSVLKLRGYTPEEVISQPVEKALTPESAKRVSELMAVNMPRFFENGGVPISFVTQVDQPRKDGSIVQTEVTTTFVLNHEKRLEIVGVSRDITERKLIEKTLFFLTQRGWAERGGDFFSALAQYLGETLSIDYVFISRVDREANVARTLANYQLGEIRPNVEYSLQNTPCANVLDRTLCLYPEHVQQEFPLDSILSDLGAESYSGVPLWDSNGDPIGLITLMHRQPMQNASLIQAVLQIAAGHTGHEIERREAELALRESENRYRTLVSNMPVVIFVIDKHGIFTFSDGKGLEKLGLRPGQVVGLSAYDVYRDSPHIIESVKSALLGQSLRNETPLQGLVFDVSWTPLFDKQGNVERMIGVANDITERKRAEDALRERDEQYRAIVEQSNDGISIADQAGRYVMVNQAFCTMLGYTKEELLQMKVTDLLPGDIKVQLFFEVSREGKSGQREAELLRKDGVRISVSVSGAPLKIGNELYVQGIVRDISERKRSEEKIQRQLARLKTLSEIDRTIASSFDLRFNLMTLLQHAIAQLNIDAADILLLNPGLQILEYAASQGFNTHTIERARVRLGQGYAGQAALNRQNIHVADLQQEPVDSPLTYLAVENFVMYHAVPLVAKGQIRGVLEVFHRSSFNPEKEWFDFLEILAGQAAIAIDNAGLFAKLQRSNDDLKLAYDATIEGWSHALDLRDKETEGHTQRVVEMTLQLARMAGISDEELVHIRRGALLHDIGKMGIPDSILLKPAELTAEEMKFMQRHPTFAFEFLSPIRYLTSAAIDIPYCHHEKWDGTGYPRGLKGQQIPLAARLFAVVDVWDALINDRPYRAAWSREKALEYIREQSGKHFDPHAVQYFLHVET